MPGVSPDTSDSGMNKQSIEFDTGSGELRDSGSLLSHLSFQTSPSSFSSCEKKETRENHMISESAKHSSINGLDNVSTMILRKMGLVLVKDGKATDHYTICCLSQSSWLF
jgi:hypothetical protein